MRIVIPDESGVPHSDIGEENQDEQAQTGQEIVSPRGSRRIVGLTENAGRHDVSMR
jgi:hypothetical protein